MLFFAADGFANDFAEVSPPEPFPTLEFQDEQGTVHTADAAGAKLTLVHFWATWCGPCVREFPKIDALQQRYGGKGLRILTLSVEGARNFGTIDEFFSRRAITHIKPYVANTNAVSDMHLRGIPTTFFVNHDGQKIAVAEGPVNWDGPDITAFIEKNLK